MNRTHLDHGLTRPGGPLIVPAGPPVATEPGEGPLDGLIANFFDRERGGWPGATYGEVLPVQPVDGARRCADHRQHPPILDQDVAGQDQPWVEHQIAKIFVNIDGQKNNATRSSGLLHWIA